MFDLSPRFPTGRNTLPVAAGNGTAPVSARRASGPTGASILVDDQPVERGPARIRRLRGAPALAEGEIGSTLRTPATTGLVTQRGGRDLEDGKVAEDRRQVDLVTLDLGGCLDAVVDGMRIRPLEERDDEGTIQLGAAPAASGR